MCGIIGYVGKGKKALHVLIEGLKALEYRGYDSAGIALNVNDNFKIIKSAGKLQNLENKINEDYKSNIGIGHTRWATHGEANEINSHPHNVGNIILVHNGIIENYESIKKNLMKDGYKFNSCTDTEVLCGLIDKIYKENKNKLETLKKVKDTVTGSYALGIIFDDDKDHIYSMRKDSPLIIAIGENENYIASDVPAVLSFTNKYILLESDEFAIIGEEVEIYNSNLELIKKDVKEYEGTKEIAMKNGYEHFMLKEINDEPKVILDTYKQFITDGGFSELIEKMPNLKKYKSFDIVACGSAYHAGLIGKSVIEEYANIPVNVELASEYRYKKNFSDEKTLTILISQSGETADTLAALRKAKEKGMDTLGIINVVGSSIAREADKVIYIKAGCEIAVATTKAYLAQVLILILIGINKGLTSGNINAKEANEYLNELSSLPNMIKEIIKNQNQYKEIAKGIYNQNNIFFLGRGVDYAISMEGSLKLKEISYIHSEAYAAGELKHGTISLIEKDTPIISIITDEKIEEKTISNIKETKSRGSKVILLTTNDIFKRNQDFNFYDKIILIPNISKIFRPILAVIPLQILSYEVAKLKGENIDQPRNLAKSVTVE